jgi:hypothetical protein
LTFATTAVAGTTPAERMRIDSAGRIGIGIATLAGYTVRIGGTTGTEVLGASLLLQQTASTNMIDYRGVQSLPSIPASAVTFSSLIHFYANTSSIGAGSTLTNAFGFHAESTIGSNSSGTVTNAFGFYGNIASGTNRYNIYMAGTAANYMAGRLGVGATLTTGAMAQITNTTAADVGLVVRGASGQTTNLFLLQNSASTTLSRFTSTGALIVDSAASGSALIGINGSVTGVTTAWGMLNQPVFASDVTVGAEVYRTAPSTAAASFTLTTMTHFRAGNMTIGAGSTVTNQRGFSAGALSGATNNFGFYGDVAAATGSWNLYMNGTAANYMAGRLGVGATLTSGAMTRIVNTTASDIALLVKGAASQTGTILDIKNSADTTIFYVGSTGNLSVGNAATGTAKIEIGEGRTVNGGSFLDLVGDTTYTDYGLRLIRNGGVNATSELQHRGTGNFVFGAQEAAPIIFNTTNTERMRIDTAGNVLVGMTTIATSSAKTVHIGNGTAPTANPTAGGVLYVESGALKYRGSSGTVTTIANA